MSNQFLSIEDAARYLQLHVKTVRAYVREGRLKATRIGKQYRISREDFEAFTGQPMAAITTNASRRTRHVEVSSVVEIDAIDRDGATRISNALVGTANARRSATDSLRIESIYDAEAGRLRVIVLGGVSSVTHILNLIGVLMES